VRKLELKFHSYWIVVMKNDLAAESFLLIESKVYAPRFIDSISKVRVEFLSIETRKTFVY
jgi:hypothetical protein